MMLNQMNPSALIVFGMIQFVLSAISIEAVTKEDKTFQNLMSALKLNQSYIIDSILTYNWTKNHECLNELNAIKNGVSNQEKWATKLIDAWGGFPSGILEGNRYDLGSFSECFHIERSKKPVSTQYCVLEVFRNCSMKYSKNITKIGLDTEISLGICLPRSCQTTYLAYVTNQVTRRIDDNLSVGFSDLITCQFEEKLTDWRPIDFVAVGLFGFLLLLMVASTAYDIIYTILSRTKYQPLVVFSMYTNGMKLFACPPPSSGTIQCLEGLRVLSIMWIVYNHVYRRYGFIPLHEPSTFDKYIETYHSALSNAPMPVNTFLTLSGLLVSNKLFKLLKKEGKLQILSLYWNRYLRLTPAYGACILATISIIRYCGNGPLWLSFYTFTAKDCEIYWWSSLLYVQNYVNPDDVCVIPTWYLSVDTQLYIIAPLLVYLIHRYTKTTLTAFLILILSCIGNTIRIFINNNIQIAFTSRYSPEIYFATHVRFPSWLIGFITGYILFKYPKGSICIPKKVNVCAWTISLLMIPIIVFANYPFVQSIPMATALQYGLTESLSNTLWSVAVCYIVFACRYGSGGPVDWFLSLPVWMPLSKLSYAIYLNHYFLLLTTFYSIETPQYFSGISAFRNYVSIFVLSTLLAIPMTLAFELPIDAINRLTNGASKSKNQPNNTPTDKSNTTHDDRVNLEKFVMKSLT